MNRNVPSIKELRTICQTPESSLHDSPICASFLRKISIYITRFLLYTPITANHVTIIMIIAGIACGTLFIFGKQEYLIAGFTCFFIMALLDAIDGEIARARVQTGSLGVYLDRLCHFVTYPYILIGAGIGTYNISGDMNALLFGFLASFFWSVANQTRVEKQLILYKTKSTIISNHDEKPQVLPKPMRIVARLINPTSVDIMLIGFFFAAILNQMFIVIIILGIAMPLWWLRLLFLDISRGL